MTDVAKAVLAINSPESASQLEHNQHTDKEAIAAAFGKAAANYDKSAAFQRLVGHQLIERLPTLMPVGSKLLDVGCGTGYFSEQLANRGFDVCATDLSSQMLEQAKQRCGTQITYQQGDAENLPFSDNSFDVAYTSLALQWCPDLSIPLKELRRVVKPGGCVLFTTLAENSLHELRYAWLQVDQYQHVNHFLSQKAVKLALAQAGGEIDTLEFLPITVKYNTAVELMKDLKGIGATHLQRERKAGLASRKTIQALERAYDEFRDEKGQLPATYQVCFGVIIND
ncbi:malonyl-ACP O-methyltransferase BioC [Photobacterium sanguinicancri]|uniref:malonyl-ACP O-methyltransferase BioC n=1 Tax=Photobacterium sanguinicancri TaxID=875932 RepID=UPI0026E4189E|nr:malonyl-ACP O-methyltransferase BioC [Photobacterium sanguinicancri]MDO6497046.1 malonyl-ACP O-methyltransferase BioC [Photobacterium sanguinicancri]